MFGKHSFWNRLVAHIYLTNNVCDIDDYKLQTYFALEMLRANSTMYLLF